MPKEEASRLFQKNYVRDIVGKERWEEEEGLDLRSIKGLKAGFKD